MRIELSKYTLFDLVNIGYPRTLCGEVYVYDTLSRQYISFDKSKIVHVAYRLALAQQVVSTPWSAFALLVAILLFFSLSSLFPRLSIHQARDS